MKINRIDTAANLSKAEEIKILETLRKAFVGSGNYLEAFFSKDLVSWASQNINDDFFPNAYNLIEQMTNTTLDNRRRITELERQLEEKNRMIQGLREDLEVVAKDRDIASRAAQEYRSLYNKADQKAQKVNELREALKAVLESED